MSADKGRTPDFVLKALDKVSEKRGKVGAAWQNKDGSISIVLDAFVHLDGREKLALILFPKDLEE